MAGRGKMIHDEYDSPWKEALANYLPFFFELFFPEINTQIDWCKPYEFLETELRKLLGESEMGKREADALVKLYRLDESEVWVLIHMKSKTAEMSISRSECTCINIGPSTASRSPSVAWQFLPTRTRTGDRRVTTKNFSASAPRCSLGSLSYSIFGIGLKS